MKLIVSLVLMLWSSFSSADNMQPASLTIHQVDVDHFDVSWKIPAKGDRAPKLDVKFNEGIQITKPRQRILFPGAFVQRWQFKFNPDDSDLTIRVEGLLSNPVDVLVRIVDVDGSNSITEVINADQPVLVIPGNFEKQQVVATYLFLGVEHILFGFDHLLFIACLIYIARSRGKILLTITGFTIAHSITLFLAATDTVSLDIPAVEAAIALSIVFLSREILRNRKQSLSLKYPILVSSSFGLLHGFGFASVLADIGLPANEKVAALLSFNVGVEIGQVLFVLVVAGLARLLQVLNARLTLDSYRLAIGYFCGSMATVWLVQRLAAF
jgi:hydrogenase/urease accessory protein HupE